MIIIFGIATTHYTCRPTARHQPTQRHAAYVCAVTFTLSTLFAGKATVFRLSRAKYHLRLLSSNYILHILVPVSIPKKIDFRLITHLVLGGEHRHVCRQQFLAFWQTYRQTKVLAAEAWN